MEHEGSNENSKGHSNSGSKEIEGIANEDTGSKMSADELVVTPHKGPVATGLTNLGRLGRIISQIPVLEDFLHRCKHERCCHESGNLIKKPRQDKELRREIEMIEMCSENKNFLQRDIGRRCVKM